MTRRLSILARVLPVLAFFFTTSLQAQMQGMQILNEPPDISTDFRSFKNTYYLADRLSEFDPQTGQGKLTYQRYEYSTRQAFNNMMGVLQPVGANEFPGYEYEASPNLDFSISFVSPRVLRIKACSGQIKTDQGPSLMLVNGKAPIDDSWTYRATENGHSYSSACGKVVIETQPWHVAVYDADGKLLTSTLHNSDVSGVTFTPVLPFSFVRRASDYSRSFSATFSLEPNEKLFGCGESFKGFDKRGQKVILYADDANGVLNETMYKPIPFYMSSRGYGVFMHTSTPIACDFGKYFDGANAMMIGDENLDLFIFIGSPKEILSEYTALTGRAQMPPLWSFGFWMSRITYLSQEEGFAVADNLRVHKIPSDVIHFDTGWFETDWRCDYEFSPSRFEDAGAMIRKLDDMGLKICLWQIPYFVPRNTLFQEIMDKDLYVKSPSGGSPYEDAVLDFSNPATVKWYQDKIRGLLDLGVGAIKVDFGEAAPRNGIYASGRTGFYEHNLYPLRYNKAVHDITYETHGEHIIWARSAWAGSQRYPLHWGGDAANTNIAMASTLRGGLSLGLSGFSFWSHDVGGFVQSAPEDIYRRWTPFGMLSSHVRSHGAPPTEPWEYGEDFLNAFREADDMRYRLMPYIYAQARECSENGWPMVRALFVEYPGDPGSWKVDDQYLFGSQMLVAPLFESVSSRDVYLPPGTWIDYQTGKSYEGGWHHIEAGEIPIVVLVRDGSVIPHIKLAQSTKFMDWSQIDLKVYARDPASARGLLCFPSDNVLRTVSLQGQGNRFSASVDPAREDVKFKVTF